jgi:lipid II:glycine glycyltransferase (peptidoglycan interpeptide bridge formation enzyme)
MQTPVSATASPVFSRPGPEWNQKIQGHPSAGIFHSLEWGRVLESTYHYRPCYGSIEGNGSCLPLFEINSPLTGRRGIALPFTDECPPLIQDDSDWNTLYRAVLEYGKQCGWKYFEYRGGLPPSPGTAPSISFYHHLVRLVDGPDKVFKSFDSAHRRAIRKAEASNLRVERSAAPESIRHYYRLHEQTRRKHGLPPQPFAFFSQIQEQVLSKGFGFVWLVWLDEKPIAGAVFFHFGRRAIYKFGASDPDFLPIRGNNLGMWKAIEWYSQNGWEELSMGRTELENAGLRRFKLGWGAEEEMLEYYRYDFARQACVSTPDKVTGWHNRVFRAMPLFASRWAGRMIYRHIA